MRKAEPVFNNVNETLIYHYTSMEALRGILRENELCFWGTRYDSMNDPTEHIYAKNILLPILSNYFDEEEINESEIYPYVVSFSKKDDDFIMWRMYKAEVALILDYSIVNQWVEKNINWKDREKTFYFRDCKYPQTNEEVIQYYFELCEWNRKRGDQSTDEITALELTTFIKRKEFQNENEVRLFTCDYKLPKTKYNEQNHADPIMQEEEQARDINIKNVRNKDFILYKEFHLPKEALKGIIINCEEGNQFEKIKSHIQAWLYQLKYDISTINIRCTQTGNLIIHF